MKLDAALAECPVVAILRGVKPEEVIEHVSALYEAGLRGIEVPLNSPEAVASIRRVAESFGDRMTVGGGTVLRVQQVEAIAAAGGQIIVSPNTKADVVRRAIALRLDPAPGFATATEAFAALDAGARHLKLFPASTYGPGHLKQLAAVLPAEAVVWAVGGVGTADLADWWAVGARAFGLGGEIYKAGQSPDATADRARRIVEAVQSLHRSALPTTP